jgi:hypothetical protein
VAPIVGKAVARGGAALTLGLLKDALFKGTVKGYIWGKTYTACMSPQSEAFQGVTVP